MNDNKIAVFGAGCFWCVEAVFQQLRGVESVDPGYTDGHVVDPTYKLVCTGTTGHNEVAKITYDPEIISFETLLRVFWTTHNPTTLNRQGNDVGTQYRSGIYTLNDEQNEQSVASKNSVAPQIWEGQIVTEIKPLDVFYPAEDYHKNYFKLNSQQGYCNAVINPKVQKFRKEFKYLLK